ASVGRAIVVVGGGLVDENRQVDTLNAMGHFAYETLLARGFSKDQVKYLNPDATQLYDGDGDGFSDDIDGEPDSSSLQNAIETWATTEGDAGNPPVGAGVPLIIYLIDHGSSSNFLINYDDSGAPDLVSASDLDAWISSVESGTSVDVVVIYDACYSGAFLSTLGTGGPNRMVLTSSSSTQSAYFGVNGTVSFSQFFWQHIRQSKTVLESFNSAESALASWSGQTPWLDDNGTGVYETAGGSKDGAWAAEFEIGADFSTGALLPELSACVEDFPLDSSTCYTSHLIEEGSSVVLYAQVGNVQPDELGAVFAIISPPGYSPPDAADGSYETPWLVDENGNPLSRAYLEWDASEGHFSHTFTPEEISLIFDVNGRYTATLFSMDKSGQASASFDVNLTIFGPDPYEPDDSWSTGSTIVVDSEHAQAHNFHDSYDEDWVTFTVFGSTAKYHKIYTENLAENCDTVLELYGESLGSLTPLIISDDDSGSEYGASMIYKLLEPGTYHVLCRHYDGTVYGEFTEYDLRVAQEDLTTGTLEGYITDLETGYGLYGANVTLYLAADNILETTTGTGGHYIFHNEVPAGEGYTLEASKANYLEVSTGCPPISIGGISRQDLALEPKSDTGVLAGYVYDGSTVLPDVSIYVGSKSTDSDGDGFYLFRLSPGSYSIWALQAGYDNYYAGDLSVTAGETTIHDIYMQAEDLDGDGLSDIDEQDDACCTLYDNPDTDGDGLCDGNTSVYDGSTLLCEAGEDMNLNGVVDDGETDPCEPDTDGDSTNDLDDCDPVDPNNWSSCDTCVDSDGDGWYTGCDAYTTINGPDCDDTDENNWESCATCVDDDTDSWYVGCDAYTSINGPDCDDTDENNWDSCATCVDGDTDSWYVGCDAYTSINGPDCDDTDVDNWTSCDTCSDGDGDTWYDGCDAYTTRNGPDCDDTDVDNWTSCDTCQNNDSDSWYAGCDAYVIRDGPDCDDTDQNVWDTCETCVDDDADTYYELCNQYVGINGPDCDDADENNWESCATCVDGDTDTWYVGCDAYVSIDGPDCDDEDENNWESCASCVDGDTDTWYVGCDAYVSIDGPDCDDTDVDNWTSCGTCADNDGDTWYAGCDAYTTRNGPDCDDGNSVVYPGAPELCDGIDNQCPGDDGYGTVDEGCDSDGDGLSNSLEDSGCTDSSMADTDGDGLCDGNTSVYDGSTLLCSAGEDMDLDGVVDSSETDPCNPDTDEDGVGDGDEVTQSMNPLYWDSDGDGLPDKFEYDNRSGHADGENLDPVDASDGGTTDFDSDLNPNVHEYWNGTDLWSADPQGHHGSGQVGCAYWGEGDGDAVVASGDVTVLKSKIAETPTDYSNVIPGNADTQDLDGDGVLASGDLTILKSMVSEIEITSINSRAAELVVLSEPSGSVQMGETCHVTLGVLSENQEDNEYTAGFAVVFQVGSASTGTATLWGGDGEYSDDRYDFSGPVDQNAPARITLRIDSAGTVYLEPFIPECQSGSSAYEGRYCPEILMSSPISIEGTE
ncbi:MAG: C13 family peptidase, partial [bacterium]